MRAKSAILDGDTSKFGEIMTSIQSSAVFTRVMNLAETTSGFIEELADRIQRLMPGINMIKGLVLVGAGAMMWGVKSALAPIIGFLLIAWGISIAFPETIQLIVNMFNQVPFTDNL